MKNNEEYISSVMDKYSKAKAKRRRVVTVTVSVVACLVLVFVGTRFKPLPMAQGSGDALSDRDYSSFESDFGGQFHQQVITNSHEKTESDESSAHRATPKPDYFLNASPTDKSSIGSPDGTITPVNGEKGSLSQWIAGGILTLAAIAGVSLVIQKRKK